MRRHVFLGVIIGLLSSAIGLLLSSYLFSKNENIVSFLRIATERGLMVKLISLGAVINLLVFYIFIRKRKDNYAKGVLIATILIAIKIYILKWFNYL